MPEYVRGAVSRSLGTLHVRVLGAEETVHTVMVNCDAPASHTFSFAIPGKSAELSKIFVGADLQETMARIAIAQAQRHRARPSGDNTVALDLACRPWLGDLLSTPFGGATAGVEALQRRERERDQHSGAWRSLQSLVGESGLPTAQNCVAFAEPGKADRRVNWQLSTLVNTAIALKRRHGNSTASAFLYEHAVPVHVQLRVMARVALRRKE